MLGEWIKQVQGRVVSEDKDFIVVRKRMSLDECIAKIEREYNEGTPLLIAIQNNKQQFKNYQRSYLRRRSNTDYLIDYARPNYEVIDLDGLVDLAKKNGIMVYTTELGTKHFL